MYLDVLGGENKILRCEAPLVLSHLAAVDEGLSIEEAVLDKGYHAVSTLVDSAHRGIRSYIPERKASGRRNWKNKPAGSEHAFRGNRRRIRGPRNAGLQRLRSEYVERTFAHSCESGGGRRSDLRGVYEVGKRWLGHLAARNLGVIVRSITGVGTPRSPQEEGSAASRSRGLRVALIRLQRWTTALCAYGFPIRSNLCPIFLSRA